MEVIKELFKIRKGKKEILLDEPSKESTRYIQIDDLRNDNNIKYCNVTSKSVLVDLNDIIIAWDGANAGTIGFGLSGAIGSTLAKLEPKKDGFYSYYVAKYLQSKFRYLRDNCTGATIPHISKAILENLEVPLPPLQTQKKIVEVLDKAQALIDWRKEQIGLLDDLIQAIFYDMFGDPVTNPKGWEVHNLQEFYQGGKKSIKCGPFGSALKKDEYTSEGIPVWVMDNIIGARFIDKPFMYIDKNKYKELGSYLVCNGDIIISRAGTVGKMCEVKTKYTDSIISTNLIRLRLNDNLLPLFFICLMTYCGPQICTLKTGGEGTFTHMNTGVLNNINFPYPPIHLQNQFAQKVQKIESQKQLMQKSLTELENNYNSLMQRAFKGELFS